MKTSAFKNITYWFNKIKFLKPKKSINKSRIFLILPIFLFVIVVFYFLRPVYFDYDIKKKYIENKIASTFQLNANIEGDISFNIFPYPRLLLEDTVLRFDKSKNNRVEIKKLFILISPFKINNIEAFQFNKILIKNEKIKIYSNHFKKYFQYFTLYKQKTLNIKNSEIFFIDKQKNEVLFEKVNLREIFTNGKHQIKGSLIFSKNKIKANFENIINGEKYLKISIPNLKQSLDVKFDPTTTLENFSGELKLNVLNSILLLNFKGKDNFIISNSYIRNKFLNSKINGNISFKNNFYFDLDLGINQIKLKNLLMYYPIFQKGGVSKKINGKLNIIIKSSDSFFGKIKDTKMNLAFENGDISIEKLSAFLPAKSELKSNISIINNNNAPKINFNINFLTNNAPKFFRKFGIYDVKQKKSSIQTTGSIDLSKNKINFKKIIKDNNQQISNKDNLIISKAFNELVIKEGVLGIFDFFNAKKFLKEVY